MERRKAQAEDQLQTLNQECEITAELLNRVKQMCSSHVNKIVNLDNKSFQCNSKYYIAVLKFQSASIQKILEWNIAFEEFLTENGPVELPHDTLINGTNKSSNSFEYDNISHVSDVTKGSNTDFKIQTNPEKNDESTINSDKGEALKENKTSSSSSDYESVSSVSCSTYMPYIPKTESMLVVNNSDVQIKNIPEIYDEDKPIEIEGNNDQEEINESFDTSQSNGETVIQNGLDLSFNTHNESMSSSDYFYSTSSFSGETNSIKSYSEFYSGLKENENAKKSKIVLQEVPTRDLIKKEANKHADDLTTLDVEGNKASKKSEMVLQKVPSHDLVKNDKKVNAEDVSLYDNIRLHNLDRKETPSRLSNQLKTLPIISLQDRYLQSLPKTQMPDLTLRPASECKASSSKNNNSVLPVNSKLTLENINKVYGSSHTSSKVKKKVNEKPLQKFQNAVDMQGILERNPPKVGDICMIGYVQTPSDIYIQVADADSYNLDVLSEELFEQYTNTRILHSTKTVAMKKFGKFWIYCFNSVAYRVEVIDWLMNENNDEVLVQLIDYGWMHWVNFSALRPLGINWRQLPRMAQLCHLGYLYPPGSTIEKLIKVWPEAINDSLFDILGDLDKTYYKLVHVYYCKHKKSYEIDLIKADEENEENTIGQILINYELAVEIIDDKSELMNKEIKDQIRKAQGLNNITPDMPVNDILEKYFEENVDEEPETLDEAVMHYNAQDEAETCRNFLRKGYCYKGNSCQYRHIPLTSGFTNDKEPVYDKAFNRDPLPCANDEVSIIISHVNNIQCFYAQIRRENNGHRPNLNNLIKTMNNANLVKSYEKLRIPPIRSQMVIAKHWNNYWYRAQVRNVHIPEDSSNVVVEVFIVDFGDTLEVPMSDIRVISPDLLDISFQAVECRLYNVKHKEGVDSAEAKKHFEQQYLGQTFRAKIMAVPGHLEVILENDNGDDIGLKLIEDGFADLNTEHIFPADSERVLVD